LPLPGIEPRLPGSPARSQTLYCLSYPAPITATVANNYLSGGRHDIDIRHANIVSFSLKVGVGLDSSVDAYLRQHITHCPDDMSLESDGAMILTGENRRTRRKTCSGATLSTTNPTWIEPGANPGLRSERPATNDLSHDTVPNITSHVAHHLTHM
jgi:hypothetical protein